VVVCGSLFIVPSALAGGGSGAVLSGYGGNASAAVVQVKGTQSTAPKATDAQSLPFTGAELMWFLVAGSVLVAVGAGLWRLGRERS
jgi:hypothetical protein